MAEIRIAAPAKINLTLDVLGKRPDGYHEVEMVMQTIGLHDVITIGERTHGIELGCSLTTLPCDARNLAYQAVEAIRQKVGTQRGVKIYLEKHIPVAAGLAGGSSDAAAVLKGLNQLWDLGLSLEDLSLIGEQLGADVPFCLMGGTALAKGKGEQLVPLPPAPPMWLVLAKPDIEVSTAQIYRMLKLEAIKRHPDTQAVLKALAKGDIPAVSGLLCNVLEMVTMNLHPIVAHLKRIILEGGALGSLMSGTGPTVYGITPDRETAQNIAERLKKIVNEVFVTHTI